MSSSSSSSSNIPLTKLRPEEIQVYQHFADTKRQLIQVTTQLQLKSKDVKFKELQLRELSSSKESPVYMAIGKMFIESSTKEMESEIQRQWTSVKDDVQALSKKQVFLEKTCQEDQAQLRQLVTKRN
ncbi:hypothetical protein HMI54_004797 [Coelomomyces lativittatus]|nr:hypothetical protein HMI55_002800 [Coelomomyces lativittatus]KAJ1517658.1 hypothetical protein HMI54_004797 [Coelomomyces lativittatus]